MDSDRVLTSQAQEEQTTDPAISVGVSVVSAGLAGAVIGNFVAGRLGAAIGAVVGGVAGAAIGQTDAVEGAVGDATHAVQQKVEEIKPAINNAVSTAKEKTAEVRSQATDAVNEIQDKVQAQLDQARSTTANALDSTHQQLQDTQPQANPVMEAAGSPAMRSSAPVQSTSPIDGTGMSSSEMGGTSQSAYISSDASFDPVSIEEQYEQGITLGNQGNLVGSIAAFQSVVAQEPDYAEAHYNLGVVLGKHGLREQGIEHIKKSRDLCIMQGRTREAENIEQILHNLGE